VWRIALVVGLASMIQSIYKFRLRHYCGTHSRSIESLAQRHTIDQYRQPTSLEVIDDFTLGPLRGLGGHSLRLNTRVEEQLGEVFNIFQVQAEDEGRLSVGCLLLVIFQDLLVEGLSASQSDEFFQARVFGCALPIAGGLEFELSVAWWSDRLLQLDPHAIRSGDCSTIIRQFPDLNRSETAISRDTMRGLSLLHSTSP
jgi:hypothetical protein